MGGGGHGGELIEARLQEAELKRSDLACSVACRLALGSAGREQYRLALVQLGPWLRRSCSDLLSLRTDLHVWPRHPLSAWEDLPRIHLAEKGLTKPVATLACPSLAVTCEP